MDSVQEMPVGNNLARGCQCPAAGDGNLPGMCGAKLQAALGTGYVGIRKQPGCTALLLFVLVLHRGHSAIQKRWGTCKCQYRDVISIAGIWEAGKCGSWQ